MTILFADVKGSTALADRMDPEEVLEIMNGAFRVLIEPITRHGGTIARLMGDAVLAFFGAPVAHEDDADRACRAALEILEGARTYGRDLSARRGIRGFNVRIGMNTGLVVLAEVGDGQRVEYTAMGDAVNLAARMETTAEPGTILMTEATRKLLGNRFVTSSIGVVAVRGKSAKVHIHRLLGTTTDTGRRSRSREAGFVGRQAELARVRRFLGSTRGVSGGILAVTGEAGVGKSRLVAEARRQGRRRGVWVELGGTGDGCGRKPDVLRDILLGLVQAGAAHKTPPAARLQQQLQRLDPGTTPHLLPYLALLLDGGHAKTDDRLRHMDPEIVRSRITGAVRRYIRLVAGAGPVVIVWDDLHTADAQSLALLEPLLPLVEEARVFVLLVHRNEGVEATRFVAQVRERFTHCFRHFPLAPLPREESRKLLTVLAGGGRMTAPVRREILEKTQGNPLFMEEVVRGLADSSGIRMRSADRVHIPDSLRALITARIDALPGRDRDVLITASVLGESFGEELLRRMVRDSVSPPELASTLEDLCRRGFLAGSDPGERERQYMFPHLLTRQLVAEIMLHAQERDLHLRAAEAIEEIHADQLDERAETLARHYERADRAGRAAEYLHRAIRCADATTAVQRVADLCGRALELARDGGVDGGIAQDLHERRADALAVLARYSDALEGYEHARSAGLSTRAQAAVERKRGAVLEKMGRYDDAVEVFEGALRLLKADMDLREAAQVFLGLGRVYCRRREFSHAAEMALVALELVREEKDDWGVAVVSNTLGAIHAMAGDLPAALDALLRAGDILGGKGEQYDLAATLTNLGWVYHRMGKPEEAVDHLRRAIGMCDLTENRHGSATASDMLSQVLMGQGKKREADRYLRKALKFFSGVGSTDRAMVPEIWGQVGAW